MLHTILVFSPALGALLAGLFGRQLGDRGAQIVTCGLMAVSAFCATIGLVLYVGEPAFKVELLRWIDVGGLEVDWALRVDTLSTVMMFVVSFVSCFIHIYSIGYMAHDASIPRFMSYLSLFTFAMLMLVTADNLLQLYFGWEGVGVASYLLIGFWYTRPSACAAAIKAFVVNRVGDVGLALGVALCFLLFDSIQFDVIFAEAGDRAGQTVSAFGLSVDALTLMAILLFIGAMGKSAQLGLHTWLPDAMEGPTPVSALIHAATMVTAGVFLVARFSPVFELAPAALALVTIVGAATAFFAATVGLTQFDIKRVIAYSTCSQLGYMFFACGVGAYAAGIFHLVTHAFFKALLFLGAGSVIHAMSDEQDMRRMGGLADKIKITYAMMWIGTLALVGFPGTAGFFSKDAILEAAWASHNAFHLLAFWLGLLAAVLTAFYSGRLVFMTFHGEPRADHHVMEHVHESPPVMTVPLGVLAMGALFAGWLGSGMLDPDGAFWAGAIVTGPDNHVLHAMHEVPFLVKLAPTLAMATGLGLSWLFYVKMPDLPDRVVAAARPLHTFLYNKWYFDELYDLLFVRPALALGRVFWRGGDVGIIDRFGPDGIAQSALLGGARAVRLQTGYLYHYAFAMLIGVVLLVGLYLFVIGG
ncbi:MAG: NADH-quinone oxidoreductase subunit L [Geminicoccaceae bacterium]|nr:NADH-quinone oxidoreductase subunit L [Geminicoccaceae bacterium]MCX8101409.1 NADH-quinone oxidoreductase subunit L [Geminicoccaceae bacterium]MDW8370704.1 NADH-quinone oxidoreductase subunit L [Geminicoccaceae bacterium]